MSTCEEIHQAARRGKDTRPLIYQGIEKHEKARNTAMDALETIHMQLRGNGSKRIRKRPLR